MPWTAERSSESGWVWEHLIPLDGVVSVLGVLAIGVQEDVLVDPTAQAKHVGGGVIT